MYLYVNLGKESTDKEQRSQGLQLDLWNYVYPSRENGSKMTINVIKVIGSEVLKRMKPICNEL